MSVKDLQKALHKYLVPQKQYYDFEVRRLLIKVFSAFQKDYDRQVHVSRKQLSDLTRFIEANSARVSFYGKGTYDIAKAILENRLDKLIEEILSESKNTLLFIEAREKLKEVQK